MSEPFDGYYRWLGIPPEDQPPNHYRLLGIKVFENNPDVIETAADQRMMLLRTFQTGQHGDLSQKLLNEVAAAKICLLNPQRKAAYDTRLQQELGTTSGQESARPDAALFDEVSSLGERSEAGHRAAKRSPASQPLVVGGTAIAVLVVLGLAVWGLRSGKPPEQQAAVPAGAEPADSRQTPPLSKPRTQTEKSEESKSPRPARQSESEGETSKQASRPGPGAKPGEPAEPAEAATTPPDKPSEPKPTPASQPEPGKVVGAPTPAAHPEPTEPPAEATAERLKVPDQAAQQKVMEKLEEVYKLAAKRTPAEKLEAAQELLKLAANPDEKPTERFVLLRRASELASEAGEAAVMLEALDAMEQHFDLDMLVVKEKMLARCGESAKTPAAVESLVSASAQVVQQAMAEQRFELASGLATTVYRMCQRPAGRELRKRALQQRNEVERRRQEWAEVAQAQATLKDKPDDPEAHLTVGRWLAFAQGDWEEALAHFAKCSDPQLTSLAKQEMDAPPTTVEDQVKSGDAWYALGESKEGRDRNGCLLRAGHWYQQAQPQVTGALDKAKVDKRLAEIAKIEQPEGAAILGVAAIPRGPVLLWSFEKPTWGNAGPQWFVRDLSGNANHGAAANVKIVPGKCGAGIYIDGGGYIECRPSKSLDPVKALTVSCWVCAARFTKADYLVAKDDWEGGPPRGYVLRFMRNGLANITLGTSAGWEEAWAKQPLEPRRWHHLVGWFDGKTLKLFVDGKEAASAAVRGQLVPSTYNLRLGRGKFDDARRFQGMVDEVAIFDRALAADEIARLFDRGVRGRSFSAYGKASLPMPSRESPASAASGSSEPAAKRSGPAAPLPGDVVILQALFGAGDKQADVTQIVRKALEKDRWAPIQADDRSMGDPAPNEQKTLIVMYRIGKQTATIKLGQTEASTIPPLPPDGVKLRDAKRDFAIIAARYGAGLTWLDVTEAAARLITDPHAKCRLHWDEVTTDPWFGVNKKNVIWFDCLGRRHARVFASAEALLLP